MVLPPVQEDEFDDFLKRGCVISFHAEDLADEQHPTGKRKFAVILNPVCPAALIFYALTTSKVEYYDKNPQFEAAIVRIQPDVYPFFPRLTLVPFTAVYKIPIDHLRGQFADGHLTFVGNLSAEDVARVDQAIAESPLLSGRIKKLVSPISPQV